MVLGLVLACCHVGGVLCWPEASPYWCRQTGGWGRVLQVARQKEDSKQHLPAPYLCGSVLGACLSSAGPLGWGA